jgi:transaldolase
VAAGADAAVTLVSPFLGRIYDWYRAARGVDDIPRKKDPGIESVVTIHNYVKKFGDQTWVMGRVFER